MTDPRTAALTAGAVTLAAGGLILRDARGTARLLGLEGREPALRAIAISDLALAPGLLGGRPRWPWLAARAVTNAAVAAYLHRVAPDTGAPAANRALGTVMAALSVIDGAAANALRRAGR